jgi:hypothetical protein
MAAAAQGAASGSQPLSRYPSRRGLGFPASLHNLFDASHGDPGSVEHRQQTIVQDGRTIRVRATWHY